MTIGVYLIGARGNVATTTIVGACAQARGRATQTGMVTATEPFAGLELIAPQDMVFGGCDLVGTPLGDKARTLEAERVLPAGLAATLTQDLAEVDDRIGQGIEVGTGGVPKTGYPTALQTVISQLSQFQKQCQARHIVVVNLASTEATIPLGSAHDDPERFADALAHNQTGIATAGMLYAWAAVECGCSFVNFTPSLANDVPAITRRAEARKVAHAGKDGKTGETLLKTVLGPLFVARNLRVLSWLGNNYLGNADGRALADPQRRATKIQSKDDALRAILGTEPQLSTSIGYAPSLGDWKTAWDLIHFEGFLGTPMTMQFTWQGCDSALAAPLVLDLVRLVERAARAGEFGELGYLSSFFKMPMRTPTHDFHQQFSELLGHTETWRSPKVSS